MSSIYRFFTRPLITIRIPFWLLVMLPLMAYAMWEALWYSRVGLRVVHWHTHFAPYIYLWLAGLFVFVLASRKAIRPLAAQIFLVFSSVLFALAIMELYLTISGQLKTYMEKVTGYYTSPYEPLEKSHYHVWSSNPHYITKPEYSYSRPTNSLGMGDVEWPVAKKKGEKRLLALGDSFTEGDGAPYDSSYVSLIKPMLLEGGDTFYVMNAGVCGSDPFYDYKQVKDHLLKYRPDIIIQSTSSQDLMTDVIVRGGMERFLPNGQQKFEDGPWWEPIYAASYISRLYFQRQGYTELLRPEHPTAAEKQKLENLFTHLFRSYVRLCQQHGIKLFIVVRPDKSEVITGRLNYDLSPILEPLEKEPGVTVVHLLPCYQAYMKQRKISPEEFFWPIDGHHNSKGYQLMAHCTYQGIAPLLRDSLTP